MGNSAFGYCGCQLVMVRGGRGEEGRGGGVEGGRGLEGGGDSPGTFSLRFIKSLRGIAHEEVGLTLL